MITRIERVQGKAPSAICMHLPGAYPTFATDLFFSASALVLQLRIAFAFVSSFLASIVIDAGHGAGIFFGRLNRLFGNLPSRRFSGPSAEFISVNRGVHARACSDLRP